MHQVTIGLLSFALLLAAGPASARGLSEAGELEHARANARAGGPTNERDAELLERHGCLSGTKSAFCKKLSHQRGYTSNRYRDRRYDGHR